MTSLPPSAVDDVIADPDGDRLLDSLLEVYREVLSRPDLTSRDNLLDVGGSSLAALRVMTRLEKRLGTRLPRTLVYSGTSIAEIAAAVADLLPVGRHPDDDVVDVFDVAARPDGGTVMPSPAQEWVLRAAATDPTAPALQFTAAWTVDGELDVEELTSALAAVVAHHGALRTALDVDPASDMASAHILPSDRPEVVQHDIRGESADRISAILEAEGWRKFDRSAPPGLRLVVIRTADLSSVVALVIDHIAADGWSLDLLAEDLSSAWLARREGRVVELPAAGSYAEYARAQRDLVAAGRVDRDARYWRDRLPDGREDFAVTLPGHLGGGELLEPSAVHRVVDPRTARLLGERARQWSVSPYTVGLAAMSVFLAATTGRLTAPILTSSANRLDDAHQRTVGWFATGVFPVIPVDLDGRFGDLVTEAARQVDDAMVHGTLPAVLVRRSIWPDLPAGFRKEPGVYFMLHHLFGAGLDLDGLDVMPIALEDHADSPGIQFWLLDHDGALQLTVLSHRSEYPDVLVEQHADDFLTLLATLLNRPDDPLSTLLPAITKDRHD